MARHIVCRTEEVEQGTPRMVEVEGRRIGIFRLGDEYFALRDRCPHQGGPLCSGRLSGFLVGDVPGEYRYSRAGEILRCPWHGWEFDVRTGQSWFDPAHTRVRSYPVDVVPAAAIGSGPDGESGTGVVPGPYVAETFPVSKEGEYLAIDVRS